MKYTYYYQTKQNENKTGVIDARDRADAYTKLRKQGLRPYRVVGDDPSKLRQWMPFAGLFVLVFVVSAIMPHVVCSAEHGRDNLPMNRQQIVGDDEYISGQMSVGWKDAVPSELDRFLAAYAQPGWVVNATVPSESALEDLKHPLEITASDRFEVRQLKRILITMREEVAELTSAGGTLADYAKILVDRQAEEVALRQKAINSLSSLPPVMRPMKYAQLNICLRERNIAPLPKELVREVSLQEGRSE